MFVEYFFIFVDIVSAYDGEVLVFIGDVMFVVWFVCGDMDDDEEMWCVIKWVWFCV